MGGFCPDQMVEIAAVFVYSKRRASCRLQSADLGISRLLLCGGSVDDPIVKSTGIETKTAMGKKLCCWLVLPICVGLMATPGFGIDINDYSEARHDRFSSGYPTSPVANTSDDFIGKGYDWSGVGWLSNNKNRSYALLGPRHFLSADHYTPGIGATIRFTPADGQVVGYTVESLSGPLPEPEPGQEDPSDLAVGTFTTAIPEDAGIRPYSILFEGYSPSRYVGSNLLLYGWSSPPASSPSTRIGWNELRAVYQHPDDSRVYYLDFAYDDTTPDRGRLVMYDSGSPSFITTGITPTTMTTAAAWIRCFP